MVKKWTKIANLQTYIVYKGRIWYLLGTTFNINSQFYNTIRVLYVVWNMYHIFREIYTIKINNIIL